MELGAWSLEEFDKFVWEAIKDVIINIPMHQNTRDSLHMLFQTSHSVGPLILVALSFGLIKHGKFVLLASNTYYIKACHLRTQMAYDGNNPGWHWKYEFKNLISMQVQHRLYTSIHSGKELLAMFPTMNLLQHFFQIFLHLYIINDDIRIW